MNEKSWHDPSIYLKRIYVEKQCADDPYVHEIIQQAGLPVSLVEEKDIGITGESCGGKRYRVYRRG